MYHKMGAGLGVGIGVGVGFPSQRPLSGKGGNDDYGDHDDIGGQSTGQGQGQGKIATARTRRQSAGDRSDISSGELSLATSGQDSWAVSVNQEYGNDGR